MSAMGPARLELHFNVHNPIELVDLTLAFGAIAREYKSFLSHEAKKSGKKLNEGDVKLYITKIENNCILAELAAAYPILDQIFGTAQSVAKFVEFTEKIENALNFFKGFRSGDEIPYTKPQCKSFSDLTRLVANNKNGELGLSAIEYEDESKERKVRAKFTFSSDEAFQAQKWAIEAVRDLEATTEAEHTNVLLNFYQANRSEPRAEGKTGLLAIVNSISSKELPVHFISELDREKILHLLNDPKTNPLTIECRVDVSVEKNINQVPRYYRVIRLKEIITDP